MELKVNKVDIDFKIDQISDLGCIEEFLNIAGAKITGYAKENLINSPEAQTHFHHNQDTGTLLRSILPDEPKRDGDRFYIRVGSNIEYAPFIEYGTGIYAEDGKGRQEPWKVKLRDGTWITTKGITPSPFLRPALLQYEQEYEKDLKKVIK